VAAQMDNVTRTLSAHLRSSKTDLVHNAALLLGQLCRSGSEFRCDYAQDRVNVQCLLALLKRKGDVGLLCNTTFALRQLFADLHCQIHPEDRSALAAELPALVVHTDKRIQVNSAHLAFLVKQRPPPISTLSRDKSFQAVHALANLSTPTEAHASHILPGTPPKENSVPTAHCAAAATSLSKQKVGSPSSGPKRRTISSLSPWKRVKSPAVVKRSLEAINVAKSSPTAESENRRQHSIEMETLLSAVAHAADG